MKLTKHAEQRSQQRGLTNSVIQLIINYGSLRPAAGGAECYFFGNREYAEAVGQLKQIIQFLDHAKGGTIIVDNDRIITAYKSSH